MIILVFAVFMMTVTMRNMGRSWFCTCGKTKLVSGLREDSCNSQHFIDIYSITHVSHGIFLYLLTESVVVSLVFECVWEVLENTDWIIERYRAKTISKGYYGDTIINSYGDLVCCLIGTLFPYWWLLIGLESVLLYFIRDSLVLNIIMLVYPFECIKKWQHKD